MREANHSRHENPNNGGVHTSTTYNAKKQETTSTLTNKRKRSKSPTNEQTSMPPESDSGSDEDGSSDSRESGHSGLRQNNKKQKDLTTGESGESSEDDVERSSPRESDRFAKLCKICANTTNLKYLTVKFLFNIGNHVTFNLPSTRGKGKR